jgi:acyl dehydratase
MTTSDVKEASEVFTFKEEDIQRAKDLVGVYHAVTQREQYTRATPDIMRNFARSYGDDNPLFVDEDYGRDTGGAARLRPR